MKAVDLRNVYDEILCNTCLTVSQDYLKEVCKIRQSDKTCRYIMLGASGFLCAKHTKMKESLDRMVDQGIMTAKGDNCGGLHGTQVNEEDSEAQISQQADEKQESS